MKRSTATIEPFERLKPEQQNAVIGRVELGYTYEELAEALDKPSAEAARKAAQRALVRLAEEMERGQSDELRSLERIGRAPLETCRRGTRDWIARSRGLEAAERIWTWKLIPERQIDGRHDDRDILRGLPSLVASDVASTRINISVARADDMRRAFRIVGLIKRQLTLKHGNKYRARRGVPSSRTTGDVVMRADHNINVTLCLRVEIHKRVRLRFHFEWFWKSHARSGWE